MIDPDTITAAAAVFGGLRSLTRRRLRRRARRFIVRGPGRRVRVRLPRGRRFTW